MTVLHDGFVETYTARQESYRQEAIQRINAKIRNFQLKVDQAVYLVEVYIKAGMKDPDRERCFKMAELAMEEAVESQEKLNRAINALSMIDDFFSLP